VAAATKKMRPVHAYALMVRPFNKMALHRLRANVNLVAVKAHNDAKLASYRETGVTRVGIVPESAKRKLMRDAFDPSEPRDPHGEWTNGGGAETAKLAAHLNVVDVTEEADEGIAVSYLTPKGRILSSPETESHVAMAKGAGTTMKKLIGEGTARIYLMPGSGDTEDELTPISRESLPLAGFLPLAISLWVPNLIFKRLC
jgi:hypothetical protein